jgi:hypothetical protein
MKYVSNVFKEFQDLVACIHNTMHLKWKATSLDLNMPNVDYLCFDYIGFTLWATHLQSNGEKIQVTQKIFSTLVDDAKASCSSFFNFQPCFVSIFVIIYHCSLLVHYTSLTNNNHFFLATIVHYYV